MERRGYKFSPGGGIGGHRLWGASVHPPTLALSFPAFVGATFVMAAGFCCVETASETYVNCLGAPEQATQRLNLAQAFSGLGTVFGPFLGGALFFNPLTTKALGGSGRSLEMTYGLIALCVLVFAILLARARLPEAAEVEAIDTEATETQDRPLEPRPGRHRRIAVQRVEVAVQPVQHHPNLLLITTR